MPEYKMTYVEYRQAAHRHMVTCELLKKEITTNATECDKKKLTLNFYYLSGYIIECSLKYMIYDSLQYPRSGDIKDLDKDTASYKGHIHGHKLNNRLKDCFQCNVHKRLPLISDSNGIDSEVIDLFNCWDSTVRYYNL